METTRSTVLNPDKDQDNIDDESAWVPYVDFASLRETNPDITAWIKCEGTVIDYPVVQGSDNAYYLSHLPDGAANKMGSIFLDYRNSPDFSDKNSVIYGHHMKNGDMFGTLESYKEQAFYDENPFIALHTPDKDYVIELFAGYVVDAAWETLPLNFENEIDFEQYLTEIRQRSKFDSKVVVTLKDHLITLCTCTYDFSNARFILVGKVVDS